MSNQPFELIDRPSLLVVDDDERLRSLLVRFLSEDFEVLAASDASEAYTLLESIQFDLMVLDIMMPGETGLSLLERLRNGGQGIPVLMLTAMGELEDRLEGFKLGADEYLVKPFEPEELLLRIHAILRRTQKAPPAASEEVAIGPFHFHCKKRVLRKGRQAIALTEAEAKLLHALVDHLETPVSRETLMELTQISTTPRTIDVQITRLRKKLEEDPKQPKYLQTMRNKGYILWAH